jgi:hypothetical protein
MSESKGLRGAAAAALLAVGGAAFAFGYGCGNVSNDLQDAIDQATNATCARYQACNLIGAASGDSYPSLTVCQADWKAKFTNQWTEAECQGRIDQAMLGVCRSAIDGTSCTSILDVLNTFYVKCGATAVCDLPPDGGTRG